MLKKGIKEAKQQTIKKSWEFLGAEFFKCPCVILKELI